LRFMMKERGDFSNSKEEEREKEKRRPRLAW
jgi:hypothetical protein